MLAEFRWFWARLNANYWFYPALFSILAAILALVMIWLDRSGLAAFLNDVNWIVPARPNGAANMLTVMAGAMIGVASTVFSITLVAVTYASGNYGPRLLTNFMEDRGNQLSLATFIGSFVYAMVVLRAVRAEDESPSSGAEAAATALPGFAPQLSLLTAYALLVGCVAMLVFFLHHVPSSIRINKVLAQIGRRLMKMVEETYPIRDEYRDPPQPPTGLRVLVKETGYVEMIDYEDLEKIARDHDCRIALKVRTGDFIHEGMELAELTQRLPDEDMTSFFDAFSIGALRTPDQNPEFLIDELVEIGLRALSPGINDPFTAITAMHWLGAATAELGRRDLRKDVCGTVEDGEDCPIVPLPDDFAHYLARGFGAMRSAIATSPMATMVMFDCLRNAAALIERKEHIALLCEEGERLIQQTRFALNGPDAKRAEERYRTFSAAMR